MPYDLINICQVSLARDISLVKENYNNFKKIYHNLQFHIICPKKDCDIFKKDLNNLDCKIISEDEILPLAIFNKYFKEQSDNLIYKDDFKKRLSWYYQQILKISYTIDFIDKSKQNITIWDADTIILKKIDFFEKNISNYYATLFEFHKPYYLTIKKIFGTLPFFFISSLVQFISIGVDDNEILKSKLKNFMRKELMSTSEWISKIILKAVFEEHQIYNGSMFSEYELIGISKILNSKKKQKPIFTLRSGLDGKLTRFQKNFSRILNVIHVTYEHSHPVSFSNGMLERNQSSFRFFKIILKDFLKFHLRNIRYQYLYIVKSFKE